jgi:peptide/nickel transport system permease protein
LEENSAAFAASILDFLLMTHGSTIKNFNAMSKIRLLRGNRMIGIGMTLIILVFGFAVLVPLLSPYAPNGVAARDRLLPPSALHWFGTDHLGRDLLARVGHGAVVSLTVGASVALVTALLGMIVGLYSAYYSWVDHILMRVCDALMAFPSILLAIAIMAAFGPDLTNVIIAMVIVFLPAMSRTIRSAALVVREQTYIEAIRSLGGGSNRVIWLHIAPNVLSPLITQGTYIFAEAIIVEAALSFLGVGVPAPDPSWGNILHDGKQFIFNAWWITVFPGAFIILAVLSLNLFGDGLRDALDPHTSRNAK